jgi:hypothetical protein
LTILTIARTVALLGAGPWLSCTLVAQPPGAPVPADQPAPRTDQNSQTAHTQLLEKAKKGGLDIYFEGDSMSESGASFPGMRRPEALRTRIERQ